jgi:hypothetical protein
MGVGLSGAGYKVLGTGFLEVSGLSISNNPFAIIYPPWTMDYGLSTMALPY